MPVGRARAGASASASASIPNSSGRGEKKSVARLRQYIPLFCTSLETHTLSERSNHKGIRLREEEMREKKCRSSSRRNGTKR